MKIDYFDKKGKKKSTKYELSDDLLTKKFHKNLVGQYVYIYLLNQREPNAKAKGRGEVRGGGRKPWRQKGTGRARQGSIRAPHWKGGGVVFGPDGTQNYKKQMTKKKRKKAFRTILKFKTDEGKLVVSEVPNIEKVKEANKYLKEVSKDSKNMLVVQSDKDKLNRYFKNIENVSMVRVGELNIYDIVVSDKVVLLEDVIEDLKKKC